MNISIDEVTRFLYKEAALLDHRKFEQWLDLLDDAIVYRMPLRVTRDSNDAINVVDDMTFFEENKRSLITRVERLRTTSAWAETPPPRSRHFISNILVDPGDAADEFAVSSYFLILRNHRDSEEVERIFGERSDVVRSGADGLKILRRTIYADQTVLTIRNLSVFL